MNINELHYITPLSNLSSIFSNGILSHDRAEGVKKDDISMEGVQEIRATKIVPNGLNKTIHEHAVLYFNAKNPMLSVRRNQHEEICVLRIKPNALWIKNATIADRNASVSAANFFPVTEGLKQLKEKILFGKFWTSTFNSETKNKQNGHYRCAELLVPERIHPSNIGGVYLSCQKAKAAFLRIFNGHSPVPITIHPTFFFLSGAPTAKSPRLSNSAYRAVEGFEKKMNTLPISPKKRNILGYFPPVEKRLKSGRFANFNYVKGDLLESKMQTLVNTVNCKGVMGAGIAKAFKLKHIQMFQDYVKRCENGQVKPGRPYVFITSEGVRILNFPTKDHWENKSEMSWIVDGLKFIAENYTELGITSLAIPPLGCGHGKLNWSIVGPTIEKLLAKTPIRIDIYRPL